MNKKICSITDCQREFYGVSYCRLHWRRWKKSGDPTNNGRKHEMTGTSIYNRWRTIKRRTSSPTATGYKNYGGRGIKMCDEWMESFEKFYDHMGQPPTLKHTIERINNSEGYEPGNVRWATYSEQSQNKRPYVNKNGMEGVNRTKNTYWSMITLNGKRKYLGSFKTAEEAHNAYKLAKERQNAIQT